ncbi:Maf family protein [Nitrosomonas ureae]|uniref:dTTP/UTP pyrophosphatase n=1 Tax=Nitrosomonas ureae TaxID=44577 RepID=A0A2T5IC20_9PROT|nr:Maf family protein [Nitrosomonas ureae]PTQ81370.1 septum formation protein [Nitrosomonas ureae]PXX15020.1 septum formation protein [Nitrosomonas ureae]
MFPENQIYLASRSPRRRELLRQVGVRFNLLMMRETLGRTIDIDEQSFENEAPTDYIYRITQYKANESWKRLLQRRLPVLPVLVADTIVTIDGTILGKPRDKMHATDMLKTLSGRSHQVLTAIGVGIGDNIQVKLSTSTVRFREITEREIRRYLENNNILDKAGAYAIQGMAAAFIAEISGSYSGIMGLPLYETIQLLEETGIQVV